MHQEKYVTSLGSHSPIVPYTFEEFKRLLESVLAGVLSEHQVVSGAGRDEDDGRHVIETLDPLPPLVSLPTHVKHAVEEEGWQCLVMVFFLV